MQWARGNEEEQEQEGGTGRRKSQTSGEFYDFKNKSNTLMG